MKYEIEYEEKITRINSVTVEVEDECEGKYFSAELERCSHARNHPDDIFDSLEDLDAKIVGRFRGVEDVEYEIY